jgi:hypothetical protein
MAAVTSRLPIKYMGYHDVPLVFLTRHHNQTFLFECPFLNDLEDYAEAYKVYLMPEIEDADLPKDWTRLAARATRFIGEVSVDKARFDDTRRQAVDAGVFDLIPAFQSAAG